MAFLKRQVKSVLLSLAEEFDTNVTEQNKVKEIIDAITGASDYEEETAKAFLERILTELEESKQEKQREIEREEAEKNRQYELERLRIQTAAETVSLSSASTVSAPEIVARRVHLKDLVPKFDPKQIDISLFFMIFERQASREKLEENKWVSQLIPLLPIEIAEIIVKQPTEHADDFQYIKQVLFKRFKLSPRALRMKFESHSKKPDDLWTDLVYELKGYLHNWLESMDIKDFESLKELMVTEQLKKRVSAEVREHYVDIWDESKVAKDLAEKCDKFEAIRRENRKFEPRTFGRNSFKKAHSYGTGQSKNDRDPKVNGKKRRKLFLKRWLMIIRRVVGKNQGKSPVTDAGSQGT